MEPLNTKERTSAIVKMALLFLLTLIIFVIGVYFDIRVPHRQLEALKEERDALRLEKAQVAELLRVSNGLFENYSRAVGDPQYYGTIETMRKVLPELKAVNLDTASVVNKFGVRLSDTYHNLIIQVERAHKCEEKLATSGNCLNDLAQAQSVQRELQRDLDQCRTSLGILSGNK